MSLMNKVYCNLDFLPYQIAFGFSIRWWFGPAFRLYVGPWKFYVGWLGKEPPSS